VRERDRSQRLTRIPEKGKRQSTQHREDGRAGQKRGHKPYQGRPERRRMAFELAGKADPCQRQRDGAHRAQPCPATAARTQFHRQQKETDRHRGLHPPHRNTVGEYMRRRDLACNEAGTGLRQHAANERRAGAGEVAPSGPQAGIGGGGETAGQRGQVPVAFGRQCAEHRQDQSQVLHHDRSVFHPAPDEGAQRDLD